MVQQGEIWFANQNPTQGSEQAGHRPVVVVSGNVVNSLLNIVIAMPLTTRIKHYKGNVVLQPDAINGLTEPSEILIFHIRSISQVRLTKKIGIITPEQLTQLTQGLNDILRY
jgi:mRNA interferase MazF